MCSPGGDIRVRLFAGLRDTFGAKEVAVSRQDAPDIEHMLSYMCDSRAKREALLDQSGKPRKEITFLVNGRNIAFLERAATALNGGDEVHIFPPVYGG